MHGDVDSLSLPGSFPGGERRQDPHQAIQGRDLIANPGSAAERRPVRVPRHRHHPARRLDGEVKGRPVPVRAALPVSGDGTENDPGIDPLKNRIIQAEALHRPRGEIFHDHVAFGHQPAEDLHAALAFQVQGDAFLSPVPLQMDERDVFRSSSRKSDPSGAGKGSADSRRVPITGPLDLDHLRPQGGQMHA